MATSRRLVLVGAGHAHVEVVRRWAQSPPPGASLTVIADLPRSMYSGMVPGILAGEHAIPDAEIEVAPLVGRAGGTFIEARARRVDVAARQVLLEGGARISFDLASLNIGSTVRGSEVPGFASHALPTRPIGRFVRELERRLAAWSEAPPRAPVRVVVVGAGAAGVEVAATLAARLARERVATASVTLLDAGERLLPRELPRLRRAVGRALRRRGVTVRGAARVHAVTEAGVALAARERLAADLVVWAGGPAAHALPQASSLRRSTHGFIRTRDTLEVEGTEGVFAVGDCAILASAPWVPRAGVYAVRQAPILDRNLRARLAGRALATYTPQRDFLRILNVGEGEGVAAKWGFVVSGRWVLRLKHRIDRRFMRRYQIGAEA